MRFKVGQIVAYVGKDFSGEIYKVEIGKIKSINESKKTAFVNYHLGDTAAQTSFNDLYPIENEYCLKNALLGVGGMI